MVPNRATHHVLLLKKGVDPYFYMLVKGLYVLVTNGEERFSFCTHVKQIQINKKNKKNIKSIAK